jgi:hypothetical protein
MVKKEFPQEAVRLDFPKGMGKNMARIAGAD